MMAVSVSVLDYVVLLSILSVSAGIGIYHASRGAGMSSSDRYFLGDRQMNPIPIILSIVVTSLSAITYLGSPIESYLYGPLFWIVFFTRFLAAWIISQWYLPVFYRLRITSMYEYLEMRFDNIVRYGVLLVDVANTILYMGIIVYTPALALQTVTGFDLTISIIVTGSVCTFYTTIGGMKAVVWTDVFQAILMLVSFYTIIVYGCMAVGGPAEVVKRLQDGGRGALVDFSLDPTIRYSFWSLMIGGFFFILAMLIKQPVVQRFNSCATERQAQFASFLGVIGIGLVELTAVLTGIILFAYFGDCDPVSDGKIQRHDQLIPYLIIDMFGHVPGVVGLLLGGAFCASLSSVSSLVNSLAAITGEDIIRRVRVDVSDEGYTRLVKFISAIYGALATLLAFLATSFGGILYAALSFMGIFGSPVLGVFSLGLFIPRSNSKGALVGLVAGVVVGLVIKIGSDVCPNVHHDIPPLITSGCHSNMTIYDDLTTRSSFETKESLPLSTPNAFTKIFSLSYLYYSFVTCVTTVLVGILVSVLSNSSKCKEVDKSLLSPVVVRNTPTMYMKAGTSLDVDYFPKRKLSFQETEARYSDAGKGSENV